jgi:hypothetical protein
MKNILLIGDLKTIRNWGAQGTSKCLNSYYNVEYADKYNLYSIEHRSDISTVNNHGNPYKYRILKSFLKQFIVDKAIYKKKVQRINIENVNKRDITEDIIPHRWDEYSEYARKMENSLILQYEKDLIEKCECIIINAEGSIVRKRTNEKTYRRAGRYYLFLAYYSKIIAKKKTYIINHTVDPNYLEIDEVIHNLYPRLDKVILREHISMSYLKSLGINTENTIIGFDMLYLFNPTQTWSKNLFLKSYLPRRKYICIGDSSGIPYVSWDIKNFYENLIINCQSNFPEMDIVIIDGNSAISQILGEVSKKYNCCWINDMNSNYTDLYHILANAEIYVSGRWHPSILAAKGRTPIILWGADSCKTRSLHEQLNLKCDFYPLGNLNTKIDSLIEDIRKSIRTKDDYEFYLSQIDEELIQRAKQNLDAIL